MDHHNSSNQQKKLLDVNDCSKSSWNQMEAWKGKTCSKNIYLTSRNGLHIKLFICNEIDFNTNDSCLGSWIWSRFEVL